MSLYVFGVILVIAVFFIGAVIYKVIKSQRDTTQKKLLLGVPFAVIAVFYAGAMFDFFPFIADDLVIKALGFCTLIICVVIAVCTCLILSKINKK